MANTYTLISSNVLASAAASVTLSSIPGTYTDLVLRVSARDNSTNAVGDTCNVTVNNDTSSNYSITFLRGSGTAAISAANSGVTSINSATDINGDSGTSNTFSSGELYFPNYTLTTSRPISVFNVNENNTTAARIYAGASLYRGTSAITSIKLETPGQNFLTGSSFYLYGIKNS